MEDLLKQYNESIVDVKELKAKVKNKLDNYANEMKSRSKAPSREEQDGWTLVRQKRGKKPFVDKKKKKKLNEKKFENLNFYAFEVRESKLKKHKELLEKFEEDKKRLAKMKQQRKFMVACRGDKL